jgi:hypothetical protein
MTFPFGRWRGYDMRDIPDDYLRWALGIAREPLRQIIDRELARRAAHEDEPSSWGTQSVPPKELRPVMRAIVRSGHRALSLQAHPDRGGSHGAMVELNAAREWLEGVLAEPRISIPRTRSSLPTC